MTPIELGTLASRLDAVCEKMGAVLRNAAFSTNIWDRRDFSCAVFDPAGRLCAQAARIPVHLGSMAYAMADLVTGRDWGEWDMVMRNDPFLGGTYLPDMTRIAPVHADGVLAGFVANRAGVIRLVLRYGLRLGSGGAGAHPGGDGLVRELEYLAPATVTPLGERRSHRPWGLAGGGPGAVGRRLQNDIGNCRAR